MNDCKYSAKFIINGNKVVKTSKDLCKTIYFIILQYLPIVLTKLYEWIYFSNN